jgi:hypothetical protein
MPPGTEWIVEVEGPAYPGAYVTIERSDRLVVWAWDGADYRLLSGDGAVLDEWTGNRVPDFIKLDRERQGKD